MSILVIHYTISSIYVYIWNFKQEKVKNKSTDTFPLITTYLMQFCLIHVIHVNFCPVFV